ncbi:MAG: (Fe-S)-binding protein [Candidatus Lambdaproteobacteria bacterium]|nr:(Fe-S)-binding protein [Candidatus Lambdaproteobacteria bacterium]
MAKFDYGAFFGPIPTLADALRDSPTRFWEPTPEQLAQPHEYVLYLGCNVLRTTHLAEAIVAVLRAMGVDFITLGGPSSCCGVVHARNGDANAATRLTQHTLDKFTGVRPKAVLVYCPSCHARMDSVLPEGGFDFDVPYLHVTEFIAGRLGQLALRHPIARRIGLHAHVGLPQQRKDTDSTLAILHAIPGLEVVELPAGAEWGRACTSQQLATLGAERIHAMVAGMFAEARAQGCDGVAAVYHSCYRELLPNEAEHGLEFLNYVELLAASCGLGPFPARYKTFKLAQDTEAAFAALSPRAAERGQHLDRLRRSVESHFAPAAPRAGGKDGVS